MLRCMRNEKNELYFNAKDIVMHLEYHDVRSTIESIHIEDKKIINVHGDNEVFVTSNGLYKLINQSDYFFINTFQIWVIQYLIPRLLSCKHDEIQIIDFYKLNDESKTCDYRFIVC